MRALARARRHGFARDSARPVPVPVPAAPPLTRLLREAPKPVGRRRGVQSPVPGLAEKCASSLPVTPSHSLASPGASFFCVMFGQLFA